MIQQNHATSALRIARVTHVYPEGQSLDVIFLDTGDYGRNIQVMSPMAGTDFGFTSGIASPGEEGHEPNLSDKDYDRTITCVVASAGGVNICLGFLFPQVNQLSFSKEEHKNRTVFRHPSDIYSTIDDDANFTMRHPTGETFISLCENNPADLSAKDFDKKFNARHNFYQNPLLRISVSYNIPGYGKHGEDWSVPTPPRHTMTGTEVVFGNFGTRDEPDKVRVRDLWTEDSFDGPVDNEGGNVEPGGGMSLSALNGWQLGHKGDIKVSSYESDMLLHTGRHVNMEAERDLQVISHQDVKIGARDDMTINVGKDMNVTVGGEFSLHTHEWVQFRAMGAFSSRSETFYIGGLKTGVVRANDSVTVESPGTVNVIASFDALDPNTKADATSLVLDSSAQLQSKGDAKITVSGSVVISANTPGEGGGDDEQEATTLSLDANATLSSSGEITLSAPGAISISAMTPKESDGDADADGGDEAAPVTVTMDASAVTISAPTEVVMDAPITRIKGDLIIEGEMILAGGSMSNATGNLNISGSQIIYISASQIILTAPDGITENAPTVLTNGIHVDNNGQHSG